MAASMTGVPVIPRGSMSPQPEAKRRGRVEDVFADGGPDVQMPDDLPAAGGDRVDRVVLGGDVDPAVVDERLAVDGTVERVVVPGGLGREVLDRRVDQGPRQSACCRSRMSKGRRARAGGSGSARPSLVRRARMRLRASSTPMPRHPWSRRSTRAAAAASGEGQANPRGRNPWALMVSPISVRFLSADRPWRVSRGASMPKARRAPSRPS